MALQRQLVAGEDDHLLLLEHDHVVTLSKRTPIEHLLVDVKSLGADVVATDRGGDIAYHGPGQLVGYPILTVAGKRGGGMADTAVYVESIEQLLIDVLADLGVDGRRIPRSTGVWVDVKGLRPRKIAAIGVRITRGRSMHGFALNVDPDLAWFDRIVPCGIRDKGVTSLAAEGVDISMREVVDLVAAKAGDQWGRDRPVDRADVAWRVPVSDLAPFTRGEGVGTPVGRQGVGYGEQADGTSVRLLGRLAEAGVAADPVRLKSRKPEWMRVPLDTGPKYREIKKTMRELDLVTVCEEAGCPNISECWNDGTATFMILGERCTRACGFCLVDTRKPVAADPDEPARVAQAVDRMALKHAVVTMVARDDLADGGASAVAETIHAIRTQVPACRVEVLVSDFRGDDDSLQTVFDALPDVFNHNIETVARLQRAVRPSAGYARSLSVLARAKQAGLVTKSSIIVGMGETEEEVVQTMSDLAASGVDIVTIGQYLRPTSHHLPVAAWWEPKVFTRWKEQGEAMGIDHVESSPLTRSSYHAREAADAAERS
ncbi:lipoyl synthase [Acidimicrobiales bacterium]|nr:lipoyl synthase [Acidimicrobiales bacterium]